MRTHRLLAFAVVALCLASQAGSARAASGASAVSAEPAPDFARDVQPILAVACVRCHASAVPQGQLRLDTRDGLLKGGASGAVVVAGRPDDSPLYLRLKHADPAKRMPWMSEPLKPAEIETLRRWIEAGALWPEGVTVAMVLAPAPVPMARPAASSAGDGHLAYNRDVRPILAANCFACHGPDRNNRQMGLRLDREEAAKAVLPSGATAIVAGRPDQSALMQRITHADEQKRMPHVSSGKDRLSAAQIATLRRWIEEGAAYEPHWSYIPPRRAAAPAVKRADWGKNAVDAFILAGIEAQGLAPSPEARRSELLRRLSFDLTGLPPTPDEVRGFEEDRRSDAYERQVERLLASPRFGERMAVFWLDLVRYADSVGYHSDNARTVWPYRDYVVSAFNRNLPFDRFTAEQLAGDLLPDATTEQKIASGYNRLLQTTEEGGAQPKEYRAIYLADRVRNASTVWLGGTLGCAQCHDHKFDPFLARDFYSFGAFFADVKETEVGRRSPDYLPDARQQAALRAADALIESRRQALETAARERSQARLGWEKSLAERRALTWTTLEPVEASSANGTRVMIQGNDFSIIASTSNGPKPPRDTYTIRLKTELKGMTALRLEALTFEELPKGGPGRDPNGGFVVGEIELLDGAGRHLALRNASASTGSDASAAAAIDGKTDAGGWALPVADGESHRLVAELGEPFGTGEETALTVVVHQNAGGLKTLGRLKLSGTTAALPVRTLAGPEPGSEILTIAALPAADRTAEQSETLDKFYARAAPALSEARGLLRAAELAKADLLLLVPQSLVSVGQEPEVVRILPRGNWLDESGEIVTPAVPRFLPPLEAKGARATRLDLAHWLTSRENPLTARVFVNRLWKLAFGQGLSRTLEDLGSQGEWPTHPELLDWLAVEFVESGWDVKHMMTILVTSAAYRETSVPSRELVEKDPYNRLYARQARFRLDAEMVRDNALAVSGLLSTKMGGPSTHPYQPKGYWAYLNFPPREWDDAQGEDQYRRGLYTWWQRTFPQPSLVAFDAPSREECVADRTRSNVPQQALALLNDTTYVEAARVFAERILRQGGSSEDARLRFAYALALARAPKPEEIRVLSALLLKERTAFKTRPAEAQRFTAIGQAPPPKGLDPVELAAWTQVARTLLGLPELITRS